MFRKYRIVILLMYRHLDVWCDGMDDGEMDDGIFNAQRHNARTNVRPQICHGLKQLETWNSHPSTFSLLLVLSIIFNQTNCSVNATERWNRWCSIYSAFLAKNARLFPKTTRSEYSIIENSIKVILERIWNPIVTAVIRNIENCVCDGKTKSPEDQPS